MPTFDSFEYYDSASALAPGGSYVAVVPGGVANTEQLLQVLNVRLKLPEYFGFNWNALEECLRDFHWLITRTIVLIHEDVPPLDHGDLMNYINVLDESVRHWRSRKDHEFVVAFPRSSQTKLEQLAADQD